MTIRHRRRRAACAALLLCWQVFPPNRGRL